MASAKGDGDAVSRKREPNRIPSRAATFTSPTVEGDDDGLSPKSLPMYGAFGRGLGEGAEREEVGRQVWMKAVAGMASTEWPERMGGEMCPRGRIVLQLRGPDERKRKRVQD